MRPENLKLLFDAYIQCKQEQDECDGPGNLRECDGPEILRVDRDNPLHHHSLEPQSLFSMIEESMSSPVIPPLFSPFGQAPNLSNNVIQTGRNLTQMAQEFSIAQPDKSIIKFKTICITIEPVEDVISINVMRDPNFSEKVTKVSWKTCNKTALSGTHYVESSGEMIFNQGETSKDIKIKILNSNDQADDLRFMVELNYDGVFLPKPMTVSLKKISNFYSDEMSVLHNLPSSLPFTISDIKYALDDCLTSRTFHVALTHLCSTNNAIDVQLALALELSSLCLGKLCGDSIFNVLKNFFKLDNFDF